MAFTRVFIFSCFLISLTLGQDSSLQTSTTEEPNRDDIEVAKRIFGLNLGINLNPFRGTTSKQGGIFTSVPAPQRKQIETSCKSLMAGLASLKDSSAQSRDTSSSQDDSSQVAAQRRWGLFSWGDPYMKVMTDCTQILALIGSPSVSIPASGVLPKPVQD